MIKMCQAYNIQIGGVSEENRRQEIIRNKMAQKKSEF